MNLFVTFGCVCYMTFSIDVQNRNITLYNILYGWHILRIEQVIVLFMTYVYEYKINI